MKVYASCKHCKAELWYKTKAETRIELVMLKGKLISCTCKSCGREQQLYVNELKAKYSKTPQWIAGIIFCVGTLGSLYLGYFVLENIRNHYLAYCACSLLVMPGLVYGILHQEERRRVNAFNQMWG